MRLSNRVNRVPREAVAIGLLMCAIVPCLPSATGYFLSDDFVLLSWTRVHSMREWLAFFDPNTSWFYRPLVKAFYWLSQSLFGLNPVPAHIFSLGLHWANAYLLYRLLVHRLRAPWIAGLAASLLFAVSAHHAEPVSWIAAVGDLVAGLCILASIILFDSFCTRRSALSLALSVALFALGLLTRETTAILPVLVLLYYVVFRREVVRPFRFFAAWSAYLLVFLAYVLVQVLNRPTGQTSLARGGLQFHALHLDSILLGILDYIHGLVPGGDLLAQLPLETLRVLVWIEWALLVLSGVALWRARQKVALFGLLWLLTTPLLFVFFTNPTDRYYYLPSIGYAIMAAALLSALPSVVRRQPRAVQIGARWALAVVLAGMLVVQGVALASRIREWKTASKTVESVLADVRRAAPDPRDYSALYFVQLPLTTGNISLFQNGLQEAVQLMYNNRTIGASAVTCDYLRTTELPRYTFFFRFEGASLVQFRSVSECTP